MPGLHLDIESTECLSDGGAINCQYITDITQDLYFTITGDLGYSDNHSITGASGSAFFVFTGLPDDNYTITCEGSVTGAGNTEEITLTCTSTPPPSTCEIAISGVTITPGDTEITATVNASGSGTLEYNLDGGTYQSSPVFIVTPGTHTVRARVAAEATCAAQTTFLVTEPETLSVAMPSRDWLPVGDGQNISYTFTSPNAVPKALALRIEVSSNGINFTDPLTAGILSLAPDSNKQYTVNVAPYLEAMFSPINPKLTGQDFALYKRYRIVAGELPGFNGFTGTPELTTPEAFCLYATESTPIVDGFITLTKAPVGVNSSQFLGVETAVLTATNELRTRSINYDTENPNPEVCYQYPIQLYWLNRAGGWQTWVFDGKHEYEEEAANPVYWKDENDRTHLAHYEGITQKVKVFSGFIPASVYDTVYGVVSAVRVYHRDNGVWREVNIEPGSFLNHKEGLRRKQLDFEFTYAQALTVQNA